MIRNIEMNPDEGTNQGEGEGGSGRGDVGREAQANVSLRFIFVFRKQWFLRVIIGGLKKGNS